MEVFARLRGDRIIRVAKRSGQLALVAVGVGGFALAGGGAPGAGPTPLPTLATTASPSPTPSPTPEQTPEPTPVDTIGEAQVREAQERLNALGYPAGPVDGQLGSATQHAVMAFRKVEGMKRSFELTPEIVERLRTASRPSPRFGTGRHIEIDLDAQTLYDVNGHVRHAVSISSGSGKAFTSQGWTRRAITPTGRFTVTRKISGWRISPLGKLYYPSYFVGGIAVHGAPSVPAYPASHGCIRVPMFIAQTLFGSMPRGTPVIVHRSGAAPQGYDTASPPGQDTPDASEPTTPDEPAATPTPTPTPSEDPEVPDLRTPRPPRTPEPADTPEPSPTPSPAPSGSPSA